MRNSQMQSCIDYVRFTMEMEGSELSEEEEALLRDVLDEEKTADEVISTYIGQLGLDSAYKPQPDEEECYPGTGCMVNYFNITDKALLKKVELLFANARTAELFVKDIDLGLSFEYLQALHGHIFGDLYPSAGVVRTSDASRRTEFCRAQFIDEMAGEIFAKLRKDKYLERIDDKEDFVNDLAFYMGELEALHPFRDGNGRTARFFFNRLLKNAGYRALWAEADPDRTLEANIAAIDGDYQPLIDVLDEIIIINE